jgi:hypothetical protein
MKPRGKELARLCDTVARDLGDGASAKRLQEQRDLFVSLVDETDLEERKLNPRAIVAVAVLVAAGLLGLLFLGDDDHIAFWVGQEEAAGKTGVWFEAPSDEPFLVRFDQGSLVMLKSRTTARVAKSTSEEVTIDLSQGELEADIHGNHRTLWQVEAGPFRITVLGTVFSVGWDVKSKVLDVEVNRGVVLVQGAGLSEHGVKVAKGHHLRADSRTGAMALKAITPRRNKRDGSSLIAPDDQTASLAKGGGEAGARGEADNRSPSVRQETASPGPAGRDAAEETRLVGVADGRPGAEGRRGRPMDRADEREVSKTRQTAVFSPADKASPSETVRPSTLFHKIEPIGGADTDTTPRSSWGSDSTPDERGWSAAPAQGDTGVPDADDKPGHGKPTWLALYERNLYDAAVRRAQETGFDTLVERLPAGQLWKLMDATRSAGRPHLAVDALLAFRSRFKQTEKAKTAAFLLGKIHSDRLGDERAASRWFKTYLREYPKGPLAEEALGRRIVLCHNMGEVEEARSAAAQYLKKYPEGSFREVARAVAKGW